MNPITLVAILIRLIAFFGFLLFIIPGQYKEYKTRDDLETLRTELFYAFIFVTLTIFSTTVYQVCTLVDYCVRSTPYIALFDSIGFLLLFVAFYLVTKFKL